MAGFRREPMMSRAGRKIKPTRKVEEILCQSLRDALDEVFQDAEEGEGRVIRSMTSHLPPHLVQEELEAWVADRQEMARLADEVQSYLPQVELDSCAQRCQALMKRFTDVECEAHQYIRAPYQPVTVPPQKLQDITRRSRTLQFEIEDIEKKLHGMSVEERQGKPTSSTPRDDCPGRAPAPSVSAVRSSAGDNTGAEETATTTTASAATGARRSTTTSVVTATAASQATVLAGHQATTLPTIQATVPADSTADALHRLATVLEGKQQGGRLPRIEPEVFKGDLTLFPGWWQAFETLVVNHARTEQEKMFYLNKYTSGKANDCIRGFLGLYNDDTAYTRARHVILSRYGNRLKIAEAFKARLTGWSIVKDADGAGLQAYSDFLWQCHAAMESLDYLTNLNCQEENVRMALKLPQVVVERWDRIVDSAMYGEEPDMTEEPSGLVGRFPTFHEFCRFVGREARILSGSCYRSSGAKDAGGGKRKSTALQATVAETTPPAATKPAASTGGGKGGQRCPFCRASHVLSKCQGFLGKPPEFKRNYAMDKNLCFGCLLPDHVFRECKVKDTELMRGPAKATTMITTTDHEGAFCSTVLPVWVFVGENSEHRMLTYALIDSQSSGCFLSEDLASMLQVEPTPINLELTTLGSRRTVKSGMVDGLQVCGEGGGDAISLPRCYTRRSIPGNIMHVPRPELVRRWAHLEGVADELKPPREELGFGLLIGFNCSEASYVEEYRRGGRSEPHAARSVLGWTVAGCLDRLADPPCRCLCFRTDIRESNVEEIQRAFDQGFEANGASDRKLSQDDAKFLSLMESGMKRTDSAHYQVPLPFKTRPTSLPDSRPMAYKRLCAVKSKMQRNPEFGRLYAEFMNGVINSGQAELVPQPDDVAIGERWYWCCHGVEHPRKPGKVRGTFDGAAEVAGVSINSLLLSGPDQTNNLVGVLARFRREMVAVTCDIEGMFLQVAVDPADRQYLRFLWYEGGDTNAPVREYQMAVTLFGASSSPGCAGLALRKTADRFEQQYGSAAAEFVRDDFYVDDGLGATPDDASAIDLIHNSRGLCDAGGFNLCKFSSSSRAVIEAIPPDWRAKSLRSIELQQTHLPNERTLGLLLSLEKDAFLYAVELLSRPDTRRGYLSALSSIFDPLGFVAPALLPGRLLLQEICGKQFGWDDPLDETIRERWREWYESLEQLNAIEIPRCVRAGVSLPFTRVELHVFADASSKGYGACCYLLLADEEGHCRSSLMYSKARVVPSKPTTIPRLELQAAVLGVKMGRFLAEELKYPALTSHYWSDSNVALGYILNEARRFHVYVANRSQFIRSHTEGRQWHHIDTERNPADLASRGVTGAELTGSQLWWSGPEDIRNGDFGILVPQTISALDPELKRETVVLVSVVEDNVLELLMTRCSSWGRMVGAVATCLRFIALLRRSGRDDEDRRVQYRADAREHLLKTMQIRSYPREIELLKGQRYPDTNTEQRERRLRIRSDSNLYKLDVYIDQRGLLRVGGRLRRSGLPAAMIHPVVVSSRHPLSRALARHYHEKSHHMGALTTLNAVRQAGYWLVSGRTMMSSVVSGCVPCRRHRGRVVEQRMADLPEDRFETAPPFTYVAADLFGPIMVKVGRSMVKWWVCIFVCMASRAVHLEPVNTLDVSGFIQAYRRFVARRGPVRTLRCDRGTNFTGARTELENAWKSMDLVKLGDELRRRDCDMINFRFNYPRASHMAGSWERMIRTVRSAFWQTLQKHGESLGMEVFFTLVTEAEALVNSRPLTTVDMTDDTSRPALTPAQLLTMKADVLAPPPGNFKPEDRYSRKRWRLTQHLADQFWRRWIREYALLQQGRQKWNDERDNLRIDDIVLLVETENPRGSWPMGRVISVAPSDDQLVRKVTVKTSRSELQRPVQKLVLLHRPYQQPSVDP